MASEKQYSNKKLRVGILIRETNELRSYELKILKKIFDHPRLELILLIKDGRIKERFAGKVKRALLTRGFLANILFEVQKRYESRIFSRKINTGADETTYRNEIAGMLSSAETVYLTPERKGFSDIFSKEDSDTVRSYDLDIILRHEFNIIHGDILNAARWGIWSFHHADNSVNRGGPESFWEIVNDEPYCGVTLQKLTDELDGGYIIDKAYYHRHWVLAIQRNAVREQSIALLFKNIEKLLRDGDIKTQKSLTYYNRLYKSPGLKYVLKYMLMFYRHSFREAFEYMLINYFSVHIDCWALFFGKGNFLETALFRIKPIKMPKKQYWADPFIFKHGGDIYVFFENYSYKTRRGKISCGRIVEENNGEYRLADLQDVLDFGCHLSYPQIFEENGGIFMIPEMAQNKKVEVYRCTEFPGKWELYATAFEGEDIVDTTYFCDENGDRWLLLNKGFRHDAELYVYKIDDLRLENIEAHKDNPVIIDCRKGRSGGAVFKHNGEYFRPSQNNTYLKYGRGLEIYKLKKLSLEEFEDEHVISIEANFRKGLIGIHHLHQTDDCFIFDACYRRMK